MLVHDLLDNSHFNLTMLSLQIPRYIIKLSKRIHKRQLRESPEVATSTSMPARGQAGAHKGAVWVQAAPEQSSVCKL